MGLYAPPTGATVAEACADLLGPVTVVAWVVGRSLNERLLYVVTLTDVAVLRVGRLPGTLRLRSVLGTWPRGEVETEDGIASVRVGPYRAKVRLTDRKRATEVARLAASPG